MKNKKRNKIFLLLILLLGLSVGFAALATTLKINGSTIIGKNTWNIYWDNIANEDGVTPETETIIESEDANHPNNIVNFAVTFNQPGDYYEFTVDAVNAGTLDAEIIDIEKKYNDTVIPETGTSPLPSYLKYEVTYADDTLPAIGDGLAKAQDLTSTPPVYTTKTYKIRVEYDRDSVTNSDINNQVGDVTHEFSFKVDYGQATPVTSPWTLPQGKTASTLAVGDEICIEDQCFNFIRYDGDDVVMLAKWNLKVGDIYDSNWDKVGGYTSSDPGYGLQSSEARGWIAGESSTYNGAVAFSTINYWDENGSPKSDYPGSYSAPDYPTIYDSIHYSGAPGENNYSIAYYVEQYKNKLINDYGATIKDARLLTFSEATDPSIGCSWDDYECPTTSFITNTTFWLGSVCDSDHVVDIRSSGYFFNTFNDTVIHTGARPVIIVEKSNL